MPTTMKRNILPLLLFVLLGSIASAQVERIQTPYTPKYRQHPFEMGIAMGFNQGLLSQGEGGRYRLGVQPSVEFSYYYALNKTWSLRTGLNVSYGYASFRGKEYDFVEQVTMHSGSMSGYLAEYHYSVPMVTEHYNFLQANIPIMAVWQNESVHASFGVKLGLPVFRRGSYSSEPVDFYTVFPEYGITIDNVNDGVYCGTLPEVNERYKGDRYKMPVWLMLSGEIGYQFDQELKRNAKARISVYFDWALTQCSPVSEQGFVTPDGNYPSTHTFINCMNSNMIEKYGMLSFGLKYTFKL